MQTQPGCYRYDFMSEIFSWFMRWIGHQSCANHSTDPQPMTQNSGTHTSLYVVNIQQQLNVEQTNESINRMNQRRMEENMSN